MISDFIRQNYGEVTLQIILFVYYLYPIWLPIVLSIIFWDLWLYYVRNSFFNNTKYTLMEIKLPIEINKSPAAMEVIIDSMWQIGGETTFFDRYWSGKTRPYYSLELVSIEGTVHFFIWTRTSEKDIIESRIYSQYPGVEVYEVPDYTKGIQFDEKKNNMTGCVFKLVNSKNSALPIKTYVDFGLDQNPKEEHKIDPITGILEFLGSLGPGEQAWYQILIHTHKAKNQPKPNSWPVFGFDLEKSAIGFYIDFKKASFFEKKDWQDDAKKEIEKIRATLIDKDHPERFPRIMTKGEGEMIAAMERTVAKPAFNTSIRAIYIADKDKYIGGRKNSLYGAFRHFNSIYNGLKPAQFTSYDHVWDDWFGIGERNKKRDALQAFKKRGAFFPPFKNEDAFVMNGEELATLFHFPGAVAGTPNLTRIPSKKSEAPANLPV